MNMTLFACRLTGLPYINEKLLYAKTLSPRQISLISQKGSQPPETYKHAVLMPADRPSEGLYLRAACGLYPSYHNGIGWLPELASDGPVDCPACLAKMDADPEEISLLQELAYELIQAADDGSNSEVFFHFYIDTASNLSNGGSDMQGNNPSIAPYWIYHYNCSCWIPISGADDPDLFHYLDLSEGQLEASKRRRALSAIAGIPPERHDVSSRPAM